MKNIKPVIGISLDWQEKGSFSSREHYALRTHYFTAIEKCGGIPIGIPFSENIEEVLNIIDGLLLPGGDYPSPPSWYGKENEKTPWHPRAIFCKKLIEKALQKDMPMLGICAGMQEICGSLGAKMVKDLSTYVETSIDHYNEKPLEKNAHKVTIQKKSLLYNILQTTKIEVNTGHREAVIEVPAEISVTAKAPDAIIEAIEIPTKKFVLGVQWHP